MTRWDGARGVSDEMGWGKGGEGRKGMGQGEGSEGREGMGRGEGVRDDGAKKGA